MTENVILMELRLHSEAEVVRGCCGGDHVFGECPLDEEKNQPVDETVESEES
jgi:hypothetical protein